VLEVPIKGLSDVRRLPRIGKIRLGIKTQNDKGTPYPKAVDYFVCNPDQSTPEHAAKAFHEVYGDKPRKLDIMIPSENKDEYFAQWYLRYGSGSGLLCKGDGEKAVEVNKETGEMHEHECNPETCPWAQKNHCKAIGKFQFMLPRVPGLGVWQIDTGSYNSIVNLNSAIDFIGRLTGGRIAGLPLQLIVVPKEVQVEGRKKVVYVMDLNTEFASLGNLIAAAQKPLQELLLPPIDLDEKPEELYPDTIEAEIDEQPANLSDDPDVKRRLDELDFPPAKRKAILDKFAQSGKDKKDLISWLNGEIDKHNTKEASLLGGQAS
jgi:hypothetical protein